MRKKKLEIIEENNHICKKCNCTHQNPCFNKIYGYCWWINKDKTLCSHCFHGLPLSKPYQFNELTKGEPQ